MSTNMTSVLFLARLCSKDALPTLQPKELLQAQRAASAAAVPKGQSRRRAWADLNDHEDSGSYIL